MNEETRPDMQSPAGAEAGRDSAATGRAPRALRHRSGNLAVRVLIKSARLVIAVAILTCLVEVGLFLTHGRIVTAPGWVRARIADRIERQIPGVGLSFHGLTVAFGADWRPRVELSDATITLNGDSASRLRVADMQVGLKLSALLRGQLKPEDALVDGVQVTLTRNADGRFGLLPKDDGEMSAADAERDLNVILAQVKSVLQGASLRQLDEIAVRSITLQYQDRRADRSWSVDGGRLVVERRDRALDMRGDFAVLGGHDYATVVATRFSTTLDSAAGDFSLDVQEMPAADLATQSPALAWLSVLDAPLSGSLRVSLDDKGDVGPLHATLQIGPGAVKPDDSARPIPFTRARTYFTYDPDAQKLDFSEISVDSTWGHFVADGRLDMAMEDGRFRDMTGQIGISDFSANPDGDLDKPITLDNAQIGLKISLSPFRLTLGKATLTRGGRTLQLSGGMGVGEKGGWAVKLDGTSRAPMTVAELLSLWPAEAVTGTRDWIAENVPSGNVSDVRLAVRARAGARPDIYLGYDFDHATVHLVKGMTPATSVSGHASLLRNRFVLHSHKALLKLPDGNTVDMSGSAFIVPDVGVKDPPAQVDLHLKGAIPDMLTLLDEEPLQLMSKAGKPVDLAQGQAVADGTLNFRLMKDLPADQIAYDISADLANVESAQVMPGHVLKADKLHLHLGAGVLRIGGAGTYDGVPFDGSWHTELGQETPGSEATAEVTLSPEVAKALKLQLPAGTLSGSTKGTLQLRIGQSGDTSFRFSSDLAGLGVNISQIGWHLTPAQTGDFVLAGKLGPPTEVQELSFKGPGLDVTGQLKLAEDGTFEHAVFDRIRAGEWLDTKISVSGRGVGKTPGIVLQGGTLDLRHLPDLPKTSGEDGPVRLRLAHLRVSDDLSLDKLHADLVSADAMQGNFSALLNGKAPIRGSLVPVTTAAGTTEDEIRFASNDAGKVLAAAGISESVMGGKLLMSLTPTGSKDTYDGKLTVIGASVHHAPTLAKILSAVSVVGLVDQMAGNGIPFNSVSADFRLTPDKLIIRKSSAVGASMGISLNGTYDLKSRSLDMNGVLSPFYILNGIGRVVSTHNGEGLFGMNFSLTGDASQPAVSVNPLTLLAPGFFRDLFRPAAPEVK